MAKILNRLKYDIGQIIYGLWGGDGDGGGGHLNHKLFSLLFFKIISII